jgi:antitoxin component YwqK of YwqJK toxin-antitoxin module
MLVSDLADESNYYNVSKDQADYQILYDINGNIQEEGIWRGDRWEGKYILYYENGNPKYEFEYSKNGLRDGIQRYYHENGTLQIEGLWQDGKENGIIHEYNENGELVSEVKYANGKRI